MDVELHIHFINYCDVSSTPAWMEGDKQISHFWDMQQIIHILELDTTVLKFWSRFHKVVSARLGSSVCIDLRCA